MLVVVFLCGGLTGIVITCLGMYLNKIRNVIKVPCGICPFAYDPTLCIGDKCLLITPVWPKNERKGE